MIVIRSSNDDISSTYLQGCSLSNVRLTPLSQLLRRMREVAVAAARRIYKNAFVSAIE
jgi:hypothetical protein